MKFRVILDSLYLNGQFINELVANNMSYIITAKELHQKNLFNVFDTSINKVIHSITRDGKEYVYEYVHDLPLNEIDKEILLTVVKYKEINIESNKIIFSSSWATDFKVNESNVEIFTQVARSRGRIENEIFNTLKNQGYDFEHNFGHGNKNLCTNMLTLMLIGFCIDQIQQATNKDFEEALKFCQNKKALWENLNAYYNTHIINSWETLYLALANKVRKIELKDLIHN